MPPGLGLPAEFAVLDLLTGERYRWRVGRNYVGLGPASHVLKLTHEGSMQALCSNRKRCRDGPRRQRPCRDASARGRPS